MIPFHLKSRLLYGLDLDNAVYCRCIGAKVPMARDGFDIVGFATVASVMYGLVVQMLMRPFRNE